MQRSWRETAGQSISDKGLRRPWLAFKWLVLFCLPILLLYQPCQEPGPGVGVGEAKQIPPLRCGRKTTTEILHFVQNDGTGVGGRAMSGFGHPTRRDDNLFGKEVVT